MKEVPNALKSFRVSHGWYRWFSRIPLRILLTVPFITQLLLSVGLVGYFSHRSGQQSLNDFANRLVNEVSGRISDRLNDYLAVPQQIISLNRVAIEEGNLDVNDFQQLEQHFFRQIQAFPSLSTISFGNRSGEVIGVGKDRIGIITEPNSLVVWDATGAGPRVRKFYTVDAQGNRLKVVHETPTFDVRERAWYKAGVDADQQGWTHVFPALNLPIAVISSVTQVYENGIFQGVLTSDILLSEINLFLHSLNLSPQGQTFIIETQGDLVATSTLERPFMRDGQGESLTRISASDSLDQITSATSKYLFSQLENLEQLVVPQNFDFKYQNQHYFVHVFPYTYAIGIDWLIVVVIPESDFTENINRNTQNTLLLMGLTLLISMIAGTIVGSLIIGPIRSLRRAAEAIAKGDFTHPIEANGIQEVANLSWAFQRMGHQLHVFFQSLQASEQKFATLLRNIPFGISVLNAEGNHILVNRVGESILGQGVLSNLPPEQLSEAYQVYIAETDELYPTNRLPAIRALRGESVRVDDLEIEVNGQRKRLEVFTIPVFDDTGHVQYAINAFQDVTERYRLEALQKNYELELEQQLVDQMESILQSEERFRLAVENLPDVAVLYDGDRQFLYVNSKGLEVSGKSLDDLLGKRDEDVYPPEVTDAYLPLLFKAVETRSPQMGECTIQFSKREPFTSIVKYVPVLDHQQNIRQILGLTFDITQRKHIEYALQESLALNRAILDAIPDLIVRMSRNGTYLDVKPTNLIKLVNPNPPVGKNVRDIIPAEHAQKRLEAAHEALDTGEIQIYEFPVQLENELLWQEARIVPLNEDEVIVIVRGLTERKRAELALRESEERFRKAFDNAPIGISLVSLDGKHLKVNQALCDLLGYNQDKLQTMSMAAVIHPEDWEKNWQGMQQLISGERRIFRAEKRYVHHQGHEIYASVNISLVTDQDRRPLNFIVQSQDISDRYEVDRIKDEFISVVSHELRTPLTAILGSLGLIEAGVLDDNPAEIKEMVQVAYKNSDRLVRLVNDILDLERLDSDKTELKLEVCNISDLMAASIDSVKAIARDADIALSVQLLDAEALVCGDAIIQALTNLLSNAIKFSNSGRTVWLSAELSQPISKNNDSLDPISNSNTQQAHILLSVKDHGRGIPEDKLETIFGRFQQVDSSDSRKEGGTGLGLAICKSIVQQHGGQIWVESKLGQGSIFYFTLPIRNECIN